MSTKTVTIRQSCVAPSLVHASCWQAQVGHPETTGHRPSHAGWGPVGVECHLGWSQFLVGRFPVSLQWLWTYTNIYNYNQEWGGFLYDVQPDCFFNSAKQPEINTYMEPSLTAKLLYGGVVDDLFKLHAENTMMAGSTRHGKYIYIPSLVAFTRRWCSLTKRYLMDLLITTRKNSYAATPRLLRATGSK